MSLTPKRTAYVAGRIRGLGPSDAYRAAFNADRMSPKAISVEAARLEATPSVSLAIEDGHAAVVKANQRTAADASRILWSIAENEELPPAARVAALNLETRRFREYAEKQEHSGPGGGAIPLLAGLVDLTPAQLRMILARRV